MSPLWWHKGTVCSKYRMPHCDSAPRLRARSIAPCLAVSRPRTKEQSRRHELVEGSWHQAAQFGNRDSPENSNPFTSKRVFPMDWQPKSSRRRCLKARWWSWELTDQKAIGAGTICLQDLAAVDRGTPRAIVGCRRDMGRVRLRPVLAGRAQEKIPRGSQHRLRDMYGVADRLRRCVENLSNWRRRRPSLAWSELLD